MRPSNSPKGRSLVEAPRRGDSYGQVNIAESVVLSHGRPASSTVTFTPARVRTYAAIPPPAPEPTITTSAGELWVARRIQSSRVIPRVEPLHPMNGNLRVIPGRGRVRFFWRHSANSRTERNPL